MITPQSIVKFFKDFLFHRDGSWLYRNRRAIYALLLAWAAYTLARERGLLPKKNVNGKHVFITGAGSGLGRAMALEFAKRGAKVTVSDINEEGVR